MNKKFRCLLVSLIFTAMWNGTTIQAQVPHPERIYLSGTGIDDTKTWDFSVLRDRIVANGKRSRFPVTGNYRDSENIPTVDGIP